MKNYLRKLIYITLGMSANFLGKRYPNVLVFCYHGFSNESWRFNVKIEDFKKQIKILKNKYSFITVNELNDYLDKKIKFKSPVALITIDDGYKDILEIKNFLQSEKIKPTIFLLENDLNLNRLELNNDKSLLTDREIKELIEIGWDFGSHSGTHADFNNLSEQEIEKEIRQSKIRLEKRFGIKIKYFAFPKGRYNSRILKTVKDSGYLMSFTMDDSIIDKNTNKYLIPRIGVDGTHGLKEFTFIYSYFAINFRQMIKKRFPSLAI